MGKRKPAVDREDEFERDNRRMRNGWRAFAIGVFLWGAIMFVVHSYDGRLMIALRPFVMFSGAIPAITLLYTSYIAGMIKYKRDNA